MSIILQLIILRLDSQGLWYLPPEVVVASVEVFGLFFFANAASF